MNHFQVLNGTENVIINDTFQNMSVIRKESISDFDRSLDSIFAVDVTKIFTIFPIEMSNGTSNLSIGTIAVLKYPVNANEFLAFCGSSDLQVFCTRRNNTYIFYIVPNGTTGDTSVSMEVEAFKAKLQAIEFITYGYDNTPSGNYGLQVFDESGGLLFDASKKYMQVLDYMYGAADTMAKIGALAFTRAYNVPIEVMPLAGYEGYPTGDGSGYWSGDGSEYDEANWYPFRYWFQFNADNEIMGKTDKTYISLFATTIYSRVHSNYQQRHIILKHYV